MIRAVENQTLLDIAIQQTGTALSLFDFAVKNQLAVTDVLVSGYEVIDVEKKEYEQVEFYELVSKYINQRSKKIPIIENQSLLDVAIQEDGCVLAVFDWALNNKVSLTDALKPGLEIFMPQSDEFRYNDLANYFSGKSIQIATASPVKKISYEFPGEFPFIF